MWEPVSTDYAQTHTHTHTHTLKKGWTPDMRVNKAFYVCIFSNSLRSVKNADLRRGDRPFANTKLELNIKLNCSLSGSTTLT